MSFSEKQNNAQLKTKYVLCRDIGKFCILSNDRCTAANDPEIVLEKICFIEWQEISNKKIIHNLFPAIFKIK